ncbi:hypothetical protein [Winogradskyella tangerina]|uniref:hypothetical protein n=1 Tax=Winogradskyella tangerina TaxID=2023240 RepID=UPI000DBE6683|nr:hypothetical protein [Winogradskyella tangerina]
MQKVTLFKLESPNVKSTMELYFNEDEQLIFDGYDIGSFVEQSMGDSDYEYKYIIEFEEVKKIAVLLKTDLNDQLTFLNTVKEHFNGNDAYSEFGDFMRKNKIKFQQFTWR